MATAPVYITDLSADGLEALVISMGVPRYRAGQIRGWVYQKLAFDFEEMTDLPHPLRQRLAQETCLHGLSPVREVSGHSGTRKILFSLADGNTIESALMSYHQDGGGKRSTVCVSAQVGCPVGCPFCATGQQGFVRNLRPGEIVDQVLYFARRLRDRDGEGKDRAGISVHPVANVVFMGMGEPLANYDALWQAIEMLNSPGGFGLGARNMVVSTAGLVPQIQRLSREKLQIGLAVSLHAAENSLRDRLVPLNRQYPLEQLIPACREYSEVTGRRPSFEYVLFDGINDALTQARTLSHLLRGLNCHVNLIRANRTADPAFRPSPEAAVLAFEAELQRLHIPCTLRQPRGEDIDAGCGQMRSRFLANGEKIGK